MRGRTRPRRLPSGGDIQTRCLIPVIELDYGESGRAADLHNNVKMLVAGDTSTGMVHAVGGQIKGPGEKNGVQAMETFIQDLDHTLVILSSDGELPIVACFQCQNRSSVGDAQDGNRQDQVRLHSATTCRSRRLQRSERHGMDTLRTTERADGERATCEFSGCIRAGYVVDWQLAWTRLEDQLASRANRSFAREDSGGTAKCPPDARRNSRGAPDDENSQETSWTAGNSERTEPATTL